VAELERSERESLLDAIEADRIAAGRALCALVGHPYPAQSHQPQAKGHAGPNGRARAALRHPTRGARTLGEIDAACETLLLPRQMARARLTRLEWASEEGVVTLSW
jgi:hypothetical protein